MTFVQFLITYSVCWWLVLFMVLPFGAEPEKNPEVGHVPSAPAKPNLRKKFKWATLWALLPAGLMCVVFNYAKAEETIYHAGGGCQQLEAYHAPEDVMASTKEGVAPADLPGSQPLSAMEHVDIPLAASTSKYTGRFGDKINVGESNAAIGSLRVGMDGSTSLNGTPITPQAMYPEGCGETPKNE